MNWLRQAAGVWCLIWLIVNYQLLLGMAVCFVVFYVIPYAVGFVAAYLSMSLIHLDDN